MIYLLSRKDNPMIEEHILMVIRAGSSQAAMKLANDHISRWIEPLWNEESVRVDELSYSGPTEILSCGICWKKGTK